MFAKLKNYASKACVAVGTVVAAGSASAASLVTDDVTTSFSDAATDVATVVGLMLGLYAAFVAYRFVRRALG